ncbi:MAG TPA: cation-translocating P-type ATPase [Bacilli bacterium]|nr:cation-translocating P-type ATPase [Bacilli bacterium]HPS19124.1 cation-translocating P-type ATPase [Bacilli bacterium]
MFETKSAKETVQELEVNPQQGLSTEEATKRLVTHGYNRLTEKKKKSIFAVFFSQFNDPMIYILLAAALLSIGISIYSYFSPDIVDKPSILEIISDPIIILAVVVLNATIGTVQEGKAEKSLEALKKMSSPTCVVRRDGKIAEIRAEELVPGDIVILEEGRTIPADLRLLESINLKTDESSLTGESLPVEKNAHFVFTEAVGVGDRVNAAYMSTPVVYGRGEGVVIATGMNTETGKIAKMLSEDQNETTPLQKKLAGISKFLGIITIVIVILIFGVQMIGLVLHPGDNWLVTMIDDFMLAISLAVAAIPEGLPAVVTIVLALGVQRMAKANTIVRKLHSVETLGAVSVVCSDKTGTLTQNKMTVVRAYMNEQIVPQGALDNEQLHFLSAGLSLCSNASTDNGVFGDPTEVALVEFANYHGQHKALLEEKAPRIDEYPFDSVRKMMSTKHRYNGEEIVFTKGAMDSILKGTTQIYLNGKERPITDADKKNILAASDVMAHDALRVLCLAYKKSSKLTEDDLIFVGLVGMIDPPRPEAREAVEIFKKAGITTIMITGDHKTTALAIAKQLNIATDESQAMSGEEIDALTFEQLQEKVKTVRIFARVSPENKVSIVKAIKANGNIAAMTGDGVNDAPSLKSADIGIAMGITGTDVAKGAADMVLADDNFATIEKAVEEGRGIYNNIKKTVVFLLGSNIAEVLTMFAIVLISFIGSLSGDSATANLPVPLLSAHILFINLITDSLPAVALGADEKDPSVMNDKPRDPKESLFANGSIALMLGYGFLIMLGTLLAYFLVPYIEGNHTWGEIVMALYQDDRIRMMAQTSAFSVLAISELFHMFGMTSIRKSVFHNFKNKNYLLWVAFGLGVVLQFAVVEIPGLNTFFKCSALDWQHWLLVFALSIMPIVAHEIVALILYLVRRGKQGRLAK